MSALHELYNEYITFLYKASFFVMASRYNSYEKAPNSLKVKGFCGPDGTRTRDLRRDRAAF
jgi:hypothetical protein